MKIRRFLFVAIALLTATYSVNAQSLKEMSDQLNAGIQLYNEGKFAESVESFTKTLNLIKLSENGEEESAVKMRDIASKSIANAYREQGRNFAKSKEYDKAVAMFKKAIDTYDINSSAEKRNCEAMALGCYTIPATNKIKAKDFAGAIEILNKGIVDFKTASKLYLMKAQCYENLNKHTEAIRTYDELIAMSKNMPRLKNDAAKAQNMLVNGQLKEASDLSKSKKYTQALTHIETALKYSPKDPGAELLKVQIYNNANNFKKVIEVAPAAIAAQTNPELKAQIYYILAGSYIKASNNVKALETYKKVTIGQYLNPSKEQIKKLEAVIAAEKK